LSALEVLAATGQTDLRKAADHIAEHAGRRSLVVLFSDFLDDRPDALQHWLQLRARRHDVAIFHLVDPAELNFPFDDPTLFLDLEGERRVEVNPREIRQSYLEEFHGFLAGVRQSCAEADVDYERVSTDEPLDAVMLRFLARRQGKRR
jgi:uncharacterized protein (DUF58 family)